jgi:hypothetical protein
MMVRSDFLWGMLALAILSMVSGASDLKKGKGKISLYGDQSAIQVVVGFIVGAYAIFTLIGRYFK